MPAHSNTPASTTLTVRLKAKAKADLDRLCKSTDRSRSYLAAEAIEAYVKREIAIVRAIHRGLADVKAGRVVPHATVVKRTQAIIDKAAKAKK